MPVSPSCHLELKNNMSLRLFTILMLSSIPDKTNLRFNHSLGTPTTSGIPSLLNTITLEGSISFEDIHNAAKDFGDRYHSLPLAVLYPKSVSDISSMIKSIFDLGPSSKITVAARGHGHSLHGQAQAHQGVVIYMESLRDPQMEVQMGKQPYVDVLGGELWINVLLETLKHGLAPKSWTDYLHLTVGGTLSNAGISGQAFRHGPQIDNVYQLEVVTGKGEVLTCSEDLNPDLFYGVLGGLGQFGIITRARISLERAPQMVKWIRVLYSEFSSFSGDQELLITMENSFDYVEGFVMINRTGLLNNWRSSFNPKDSVLASQFNSEGKTLYCLEMALYFNLNEADMMDQKADSLLSQLSYIESTLFMSEVPYLEFLDRVHVSEVKLREKGLWEVPHPWLNLLIPRSKIFHFAQEVFGKILTDNNNGPILIYPVNKSKWNNKTSLVTPDEEIFYLVAFLSSAVPSSTAQDGLEHILSQNRRVLDFCNMAQLGIKQYLPHYRTQGEWKGHFGSQWQKFIERKSAYDPLAILGPGQRIFQKAVIS